MMRRRGFEAGANSVPTDVSAGRVFFALCLLCIVAVLAAERLRANSRGTTAVVVEQSARAMFLVALVGIAGTAWLAYFYW